MASCCERSFEDGILSGRHFTIPDSHRKQLPEIFEQELRLKNIAGSKSALEFSGNNDLTFSQLKDFSDAIARDIRDRIFVTETYKNYNPDGDSLIAICLPKSERAVCVIFGILKTGAAYLPLDPNFPEELLLDILKAFRPLLIIADENSLIFNKYDTAEVRKLCPVVSIEEMWVGLELPTNDVKRKSFQDPDLINSLARKNSLAPLEREPAIVFYTKGIHGNPVGVRLCHMSIVNRMFFDWKQTKLKPNDSCCLTVCLSVADSVTQIFSPLLKGCTLHVFPRQDLINMSPLIKTVGTKNITRLSLPHHHFRNFVLAVQNSDRTETMCFLRHLKIVICRGGMFRAPDVQLFFELFRGITLWQCNGPAETTGEFIYEKFDSIKAFHAKRVLGRTTLGKVVDNTKLYILGSHLGIISDGNQGEICVSGLCLGLGYVNEKDFKESKSFIKNPHDESKGFDVIFRTGDYGRIILGIDGKRHLFTEGREDRLLKRDSHVFSVEDVVAFLKDFSFAKEAYAFIQHKGKPSQEMIAFIVPDGTAPDVLEIEYLLRARVPDWAMPDEIMLVDEVPRHAISDEMCPHCLMEMYHESREPKYKEWKALGFSPEKEVIAVALIKGIYKFASIPVELTIENMDKSFFDLGGTSANAISLLIHLNKLGFPVSIKDLYSSHSLNDFANVMENKKNFTDQNPRRSTRLLFTKVKAPSLDDISTLRTASQLKPNFHIMMEMIDEFRVDVLSKKYRNRAIEIVACAYAEKSELQAFNMASLGDFTAYLTDIWPYFEKEGVSIVVIRKSDKMLVGVSLCLDFFTIIDTTKANGALFHAVEFYEEVKGSLVQFVPHRQGETVEMCWMATHSSLKTKDNVRLTVLLHTEIIKLAKSAGFTGIFNTTANKMSRTLCIEVYGFTLLGDFKANRYMEMDGSAPFHLAGELAVVAGLLLKLREPDPSEGPSASNIVDPVGQNKDFEHSGATPSPSARHFEIPAEGSIPKKK